MYYLKLFQNHSQYNEFAGGGHAQAEREPLCTGE